MSDELVETRLATPQEVFLTQWGQETWKKSIDSANDQLQRMVTLNTMLLGGGMFFQRDTSILPPLATVLLLLFCLLALITAVVGVFPRAAEVDVFDAEEVRRYKAETFQWKRGLMFASTIMMGVGLVAAVVGVALKFFSN